ncbi:Uncharacterised protein, partial [Mycoplasmopsis synoviae]
MKNPVDSTTKSTPRSFHGKFDGSFSAKTLISFPLTHSELSFSSTENCNFLKAVSYFSRW